MKDTTKRRFLTLLAMKISPFFYRREGPCVPISPWAIVKMGRSIDLTEAATIAFIGCQTNIPVPKVYCSFIHKGTTYIVMERIRGKTLAGAWPGLSDSERDNVMMQLRNFVQEMRALPAPGLSVQSCVGGSLRDSRIPRPEPRFGPFSSILSFHHWRREGLQLDQCSYDDCNGKVVGNQAHDNYAGWRIGHGPARIYARRHESFQHYCSRRQNRSCYRLGVFRVVPSLLGIYVSLAWEQDEAGMAAHGSKVY